MTNAPLIIFVVDDDKSARTGLGRLLRSAGFEVKTFASGQEFLDHGQVDNAGVLVLDVRMPGMGGLEVQKGLAARDSMLPIIFLTGFEDPQAHREALNSGAIAFLQKPVDEQTLLEAIKGAFSGLGNLKELCKKEEARGSPN